MQTPTRRRGGHTEQRHETPDSSFVSRLRRTATDLQHIACLALIALDGTDPGDGADMLLDARELLVRDLAHVKRQGDA